MTVTNGVQAMSLDDRLRNLEILKYGRSLRMYKIYQQSQHAENALTPIDYSSPKLASNATLTAICQLVALRMDAKRAFISLIDDTDMHILAEGTRTVSAYEASIHAPGDELMFGMQSIDFNYGITSVTFPTFLEGAEKHWFGTETSVADGTKFVISDVQAEPRVQHVPFVKQWTIHSHYIEVPLRNLKGRAVGTIGILDDKPRASAQSIDILPMQDAARMTMEYLELVGLQDMNIRAERLMQGLGRFNSGESSLSGWVSENDGLRFAANATQYDEQTRVERSNPQEPLPVVEASSLRNSETIALSQNQPLQADDLSSSVPKLETVASGARDTTPTDLEMTSHHNKSIDSSSGHNEAFSLSESKLPANIRHVFSRASNLIREAMEFEAVCFLEPSSSVPIYNHQHRKESDPFSLKVSTREALVPSADTGNLSATATSGSERDDFTSHDESAVLDVSAHNTLCTHLAFSAKGSSNLEAGRLPRKRFNMTESALKKLVEMYPNGRIFNFDDFGTLSSDEEVKSSNNPARHARQRKTAQTVNRSFPNAKALIFMPLYNTEQRYLYSALFAWSNEAAKAMSKNDSLYISGFANSIVCEVMRLEALALEKSKSDFMSSISHELRSPLHGILAATQLLQESQLSSTQVELASMIDDCGRTLLDIMNNLLLYAQINHLQVGSPRSKPNTKHRHPKLASHLPSVQVQSSAARETINIAELLEQTVAGVAAGHLVREQRNAQFGARRSAPLSNNLELLQHAQSEARARPTVLLDIDYRDDWSCELDAGSWRRIVMNLVGNSLKYTADGYVQVSLQVQTSSHIKHGDSGTEVLLTVSDTGQGISESYIKHNLYKPFSQEDNLSVGVGLGLSIVSRLVANMGGKMHLHSEIDVGTTFKVILPLQLKASESQLLQPLPKMTKSVSSPSNLEGQIVCFLGFDSDVSSSPKLSTDTQYVKTMSKLKQSLTNITVNWFGLTITSNENEATILVLTDAYASLLQKMDTSAQLLTRKRVLVEANDDNSIVKSEWKGPSHSISAPIGPLKMARALAILLKRPDSAEPTITTSMNKTSTMETEHSDPLPTQNPSTPRDQQPTPAPPTRSPSQSNTTRLLLVDDNEINLRILGNLVKKLNIPFEMAYNGQDAVDQCIAGYESGNRFHMIFMDISMPIMDGLTATRRIRAYEDEKYIDVPTEIIALTGLGHSDTQREARASGVDQYFTKPVKLNTLRELLNTNTSQPPRE